MWLDFPLIPLLLSPARQPVPGSDRLQRSVVRVDLACSLSRAHAGPCSRPVTTSSIIDEVWPLIPSTALHQTPLPSSVPRSVMTHQATQPRRLAPYPSLFKFNYFSKGFLVLIPPPSDDCRHYRTEYRIVTSDATSNSSLFVSGHLKLLHDDCFDVYSDVDREGLKLTIIERFPGSFGVGIASRLACMYLG